MKCSLLLLLGLLSPLAAFAQSGGNGNVLKDDAPKPFMGAFVADGNAPGGHNGSSGSTDQSALVATDPAHILQPQDILKVEIFQEPDLNAQCDALSVAADSSLTLPLIGTISVKDMTVQDAQKAITALYNKDYLVNPQVTVTIIKYADRSVNVVGAVTSQGRIDFPPARGLSIIDAISLAGGQTRLAELRHVKLTRRNAKGETVVREIDVDALMKKGGANPVMLQPGDIIYVPERML